MTETGKPTLGEFLRQEREKRGITIEQVASATKINIRLLHLLESDQYSELPAKPFIRGFVTSYARFIGVDSKDILTQFGDFLDVRSHERPARDAGHSGYAFEKRDGDQSRTVLWIVLSVFLVIGAIGFIFLKPSLHHHHGSHLDKLREANPDAPESPQPSGSSFGSPLPGGSPAVDTVFIGPKENLPSAVASASPSPSATHSNSAHVETSSGSPSSSPSVAAIPSASQSASVTPSPTPSIKQKPATTKVPELLRPLPLEVGPKAPPKSSSTPQPIETKVAPTASPKPTATETVPEQLKDKADDQAKQEAVTASASPTFSLTPNDSAVAGEEKPDPLNSGVNLKPADITYKVVVKAKDDVWVRFQIDARPQMKFILRANRTLVLRAHESVRFQTSSPESVTIRLNGAASKPFESAENTAMRGEDLTLLLPSQGSDSIRDPFSGDKPLKDVTVPASRKPAPSPSPSE